MCTLTRIAICGLVLAALLSPASADDEPAAAAEARLEAAAAKLNERYHVELRLLEERCLRELTEAHRAALEVKDDLELANRILVRIKELRESIESRTAFVPGPKPEFRVLGARWGTGHRFADVTEKAKALADETGLELIASRRHFGDPYPHHTKALVVVYAYRGKVYTASAREARRLRIPDVDPEASKKAADSAVRAKLERLASEAGGVEAKALERMRRAVGAASIDRIVAALRADAKETAYAARRARSRLTDLNAYLARHASYTAELGFDAVRKRAAEHVESAAGAAATAKRRLDGMREVKVPVDATSDWRNLGVTVTKGDLLVFEAEGRWSAGGWAGTCGPEGLSGDRYAPCSTVQELPHACLLLRAGTNLFAAATPRGTTVVPATGVRIEARCNDETYRDNEGRLTVRLLVVRGGE